MKDRWFISNSGKELELAMKYLFRYDKEKFLEAEKIRTKFELLNGYKGEQYL